MNTVGVNSIALWKMALSIRKEAMEKAIKEYETYVADIRDKITQDPFLKSYIACALSASAGVGNDPLDKNFDQDDIALDTLFAMVQDCFNFRVNNAADLKDLDPVLCGRNFWLARNGQTAVTWNDCSSEVGIRLSEAAVKLGAPHLHVGGDGQIHQ
jgi:hypothetical protein